MNYPGNREISYQQFRTMVTIDTIKIAPSSKKEKNLLGRIGDAFKRKDNKSQADNAVKAVVRKEIKLDTTLQANRMLNKTKL